jgi:hypothetical protein
MAPRLLVGVLAAGLVAVFLVIWHGTARKDSLAMESAVTNGLQSLYAELTTTATNQTALTPDSIVLALLNNKNHHSIFLSGVSSPKDIYVETETTQVGKTNLICAARMGERSLYGIDAEGKCRRLTEGELQSWPHAALSDNERLR